MNIRIEGLEQLSKVATNISRNTTEATRIAINTSLKWGRTRIREDISKEYNVKLGRLYNSAKDKGLNVKPASNTRLEGTITAGHLPVGLSGFNGIKQASETTGFAISFASSLKTRKTRTMRKAIKSGVGISVEIRKGKREVIRSAFRTPKFGNVVFARGEYSAMGFRWRHYRKNTTGPDKPINALNSTSVATMALTKSVFAKWGTPIEKYYENELQRQLKRLV